MDMIKIYSVQNRSVSGDLCHRTITNTVLTNRTDTSVIAILPRS